MTRQLGVKLPEADESDLTEPGDAGAAGSESAADGEAAGKAADTAAGDKNIVQSGTLPPASEQDRLAAALGGSPLLAMGLFLLAGILLAFTPCVFPMVPILSGLIAGEGDRMTGRSEEHTSELQSRGHLVCRLLLVKKKEKQTSMNIRLVTIVS